MPFGSNLKEREFSMIFKERKTHTNYKNL